MLKYNDKNVAVLKVQAINDKYGNARKAYVVSDLDLNEIVLIFENENDLKQSLPLFEKPNFDINIEVRELLRILSRTKYLQKLI